MKCDCTSDCKCEERFKPRTPCFTRTRPYGPYDLAKRFRREETNYEIMSNWFLYTNRRILCRWLTLLLYHMFFLLVILLIFTTLLFVYLSMLPHNRPATGPSIPGLSFSPAPLTGSSNEIRFRENNYHDIKPYMLKIDSFFDKYGPRGRERFLNCDLDGSYGYTKHEPCIFIKLNRVLNYKPRTYNEAVSLPALAPDELYANMLARVTGTYDNRIWLSCTITEPLADVYIKYVPERFFEAEALAQPPKMAPDNYDRRGYNYTGNDGFRRIVGLKLFHLPYGKMVTIKCSAWAKNLPIDYNSEGQGILTIKITIEKEKRHWVGKGLYPKSK